MGSRGPVKKPTALRVLEGNPGKRPLPSKEPKPVVSAVVPKPPSFLRPAAKRKWKSLAPQLQALGLLTEIDVDALAACCNSYATWEAFVFELKDPKFKEIITNRFGEVKVNPAVDGIQKAQEEYLKWLKEFGLTPAARSRVEVDKPADEGDALDRLIDGREAAG